MTRLDENQNNIQHEKAEFTQFYKTAFFQKPWKIASFIFFTLFSSISATRMFYF